MPSEPSTPMNPYQSPGQPPPQEKLSELHRTILESYRKHRAAPPTVGGYLQKVLPHWLLIAVLAGGGASLLVFVARSAGLSTDFSLAAVALLAGVLIGACARDIGWIRRVVATWPIISQVINWEEVDRLLKE